MTEQNATPRPWVYDDNTATIDSGEPAIAVAGINVELDEYEANAELIVRAVNAHDELVAALEGFLRRHKLPEVVRDPVNDPLGQCVCGNCYRGRTALAKARGES